MGYIEKINNLLTKNVIFLLTTIEEAGYEARIVGGAVRNFLLDAEISDIDIATTAVPEEIIAVFRARGITVLPTGILYGTVTVILDKVSYEITTLRKDVQTFGRKAKVAFTDSFEIDSNRRDFTMNAIYMDKAGQIYDYHDGLSDISARKVRFIGDPRTRICEDYLRILRYFRFVAYYGDFQCDDNYLQVIYDSKEMVKKLSFERILNEMLKIAALNDAFKITVPMKPILDVLFGLPSDFLEKNPLKMVRDFGMSVTANEKFCLLLKFSNMSTSELLKKYIFPKSIKRLLRVCDNSSLEHARQRLKSIHSNCRAFFANWLMIYAYTSAALSAEEAIAFRDDLFAFCKAGYADFPLRATDLADLNLPHFALEKIMKKTKQEWLSTNEPLSWQDCRKRAEKIAESISKKTNPVQTDLGDYHLLQDGECEL